MDLELYDQLIEEEDSPDEQAALEALLTEEAGEDPDTENPDRAKELKSLARECEASDKNIREVLSAALLDLDRSEEKRVGFDGLAEGYLKNGSRQWLSPMEGLRVLTENARKFLGPPSVLRPFVTLLAELAEKGISPHAFLTFVLLPRMRDDLNWREWEKNHLTALEAIAGILLAMKEIPPFDKPVLGYENLKLARDIVLVKYVGRPIAGYDPSIFEDEEFLETYKELWRGFSLEDAFSIYFLRRNLLNLIYKLSGRIDVQQLTRLLAQTPEIETAFRENYSEELVRDRKSYEQYQEIHLYDPDINISIRDRRIKGFTDYDLAVEANAYIDLTAKLIDTKAGIYLCSFFAKILTARKNPVTASALARLVSVLNDDGGKFIYTWHAKQLLGNGKEDYGRFIDLVVLNGGHHPEFPSLNNVFSDHYSVQDLEEIMDLAKETGIDLEPGKIPSYGEIFQLYLKQKGEIKPVYDEFRNGLIEGLDRNWTKEFAEVVDESFSASLHKPLLKSVIKGINTGFARDVKSRSLAELHRQYAGISKLSFPEVRHDFQIAKSREVLTDKNRDGEIRKKINLKLLRSTWEALFPEIDEGGLNVLVQKLNAMAIGKRKAFMAKREKLTAMRADLASGKVSKDKKGFSKFLKRWKKEKAGYTALGTDLKSLKNLLDAFESFSDRERFLANIVVCGYFGGKQAEWSALGLGLVKTRYGGDRLVAERLSMLAGDVEIELINYRQLEYLINTLDSLKYNLLNDPAVRERLDREGPLNAALQPFFITKDELLSERVIDAAFSRFSRLPGIEGERNHWSRLEEEFSSGSSKHFHNLTLRTSKSFMDVYYGDMGGICLSIMPDEMKKRRLINIRLIDNDRKEIVGMALLGYNRQPCKELGIGPHWFAFAVNPLRSFLSRLSGGRQIELYRAYRRVFETIYLETGLPVLLPGLTSFGIISNDSAFATLIKQYEAEVHPDNPVTKSAFGFSLMYGEKEYACARVVCWGDV